MALIHISKDPPDKTFIAFAYAPFISNKDQNPFQSKVAVFQKYLLNCICSEGGISGMKDYPISAYSCHLLLNRSELLPSCAQLFLRCSVQKTLR